MLACCLTTDFIAMPHAVYHVVKFVRIVDDILGPSIMP